MKQKKLPPELLHKLKRGAEREAKKDTDAKSFPFKLVTYRGKKYYLVVVNPYWLKHPEEYKALTGVDLFAKKKRRIK